ncbi:MAG: hypothetical protein AABW79_04800 [Nanoarchaeota archaeon]
MAKKFGWKKKEGEEWYELRVDLPSLSLNQSLKVQEMFDNKNHQRLQERFNLLIVVLTTFTVLGVFFNFIITSYNHFCKDPSVWYWIFLVAFVISAICFLYIVLPKSFFKIRKKTATYTNKIDNPFSIWLFLDLFVNILTMLAVVTILAQYYNGGRLFFLIALFIFWAFRPLYLALKQLKK